MKKKKKTARFFWVARGERKESSSEKGKRGVKNITDIRARAKGGRKETPFV